MRQVHEDLPDLKPARLRPGQEVRVPAWRASALTPNQVRWRSSYDRFAQDSETEDRPQRQKTYAEDIAGSSTVVHQPVLDLVTRVVELRGELEIAIARLEEIDRRGESAGIAEVEVRTAKRKLEVVRRLVEGELQAAELELHLVRKQVKDLDDDDPRRMRLLVDAQRWELRIETLKSAL